MKPRGSCQRQLARMLAGAILVGAALCCRAAPEPGPNAGAGKDDYMAVIVSNVKGTCTITRVSQTVEQASNGQLLQPNDQIQCAQGGSLTLRIGCQEARELRAAAQPVMIAATAANSCDRKLAEVLRAYGSPAGRQRSPGNLLYSPADLHAVSPSRLLLRWEPEPGRTLQFELRQWRGGPDGERQEAVLWKSGNVDGALGSLERGDLRRILAGLQDQPQDEPLMMWMLGSGAVDQSSRFRLLSSTEEHALSAEIDSLQELPDDQFLRHIARAEVFKRYALYPEAAQEYEEALLVAPDNHPLRERTVEAQALTGNTRRAQQLQEAMGSRP